jgi:hypothetical protein
MSGNLKMTVNVSLCGSIPRSEFMSCSSHQPQLNGAKHALTLPSSHTTADVIALAASTLTRKISGDSVVSSSQVIEPPSWAVPARGEAMLEVSTLHILVKAFILLHFYISLTSELLLFSLYASPDVCNVQLILQAKQSFASDDQTRRTYNCSIVHHQDVTPFCFIIPMALAML